MWRLLNQALIYWRDAEVETRQIAMTTMHQEAGLGHLVADQAHSAIDVLGLSRCLMSQREAWGTALAGPLKPFFPGVLRSQITLETA